MALCFLHKNDFHRVEAALLDRVDASDQYIRFLAAISQGQDQYGESSSWCQCPWKQLHRLLPAAIAVKAMTDSAGFQIEMLHRVFEQLREMQYLSVTLACSAVIVQWLALHKVDQLALCTCSVLGYSTKVPGNLRLELIPSKFSELAWMFSQTS